MHVELLTTLVAIGALSLACQWLSWLIRLPAILLLILCGLTIGPFTGWLQPEAVFGNLLFPIISLSVAIILFEGSLTLNFKEIKGSGAVVRNLVSLGLVITIIISTLLAHQLLHFRWELAALFGAISAVTGPTVIMPMLRAISPTRRIANILRWEGVMIDPIGAVVAVVIFSFIAASIGNAPIQQEVLTFFSTIISGSLLGLGFGYALALAMSRQWLPEYLYNVATLIFVFVVFGLAHQVSDGAGLLAVTVMGILLANIEGINIESILNFKESLSILLISGLFILLAARIQFVHLREVGWAMVTILLALQFIVRPLSVFLCTIKSGLNWREKILLAWIAPRGIVAAAVAAIFALRLHSIGIQGAQLLILTTYLVIIGTVVFQSLTAKWVAKLLGVSQPDAKGFLIIGANPVARKIANILKQQEIRVLLTDTNWYNVSLARMEGLECYYGNPLSEHAERHLDLIGIGHLLALTPQRDRNSLSCIHFKADFGNHNVYLLSSAAKSEKHEAAMHQKQHILFGETINYSKLANLISQGAKIRSTLLTENFNFENYKKEHSNSTVLFAIGPKGRLHIISAAKTPPMDAQWTLISLVAKQN